MNKSYSLDLLKSWSITETNVSTMDDIFSWINLVNKTATVKIEKTVLSKMKNWYYDEKEGEIKNVNNAFFSVKGVKEGSLSQPIIIQAEIGILGIIAKYFDGVIHFLMQAKIEPGNINCVQISPTVQATKSNYTRAHGGKVPNYLEYFMGEKKCVVLYDKIQSEQASRFYKKHNRNILILVEDDVEVLPNFKWMTLGQIKELMKTRNLVNMDTRTVLSGTPISLTDLDNIEVEEFRRVLDNSALFSSISGNEKSYQSAISKIKNFKINYPQKSEIIPLTKLNDWIIDDEGIRCKKPYHFEVGYFDICIHGREVNTWMQPMCKAKGMATFVLAEKVINGSLHFLIKVKHEIGNKDIAEFGPSVQLESGNSLDASDFVGKEVMRLLDDHKHILHRTILSEEGGRFYHEENDNILLLLNENELTNISDEYIWVDYYTMYKLIKEGGLVNIQLRNLFSLLDLKEGL